jgi:hypothetical protein
MTSTTEGKSPAPQPDIMPDPIDDRPEPAIPPAASSEERSSEAADAPRVAPQVEGPFEETRESIAQRYRELRDEEQRDQEEALEAHLAAKEAAQAEVAEPRQQDGQQRVRLVVDGKSVDLPLNEVIRRAQINTAIDHRLEEAKRIVAEAKSVRNQNSDFDDYDDGADQRHHQQPQPRQHSTPNERLRGIVERIQVGDADEGTQALEELAGEFEQRAQVRAFQERQKSEMLGALDRFVAKHPGVARDPDLGQAGFSILARTIKEDLRSLPGVTDEGVAQLGDDVQKLAQISGALRQAGHKVKTFDQYLDDAGRTMERKFGRGIGRQIGTSSEIQSRIDRKRAMPMQPRAAGVRVEPPSPPRPRTGSEIVAQMRRARGFPTD